MVLQEINRYADSEFRLHRPFLTPLPWMKHHPRERQTRNGNS